MSTQVSERVSRPGANSVRVARLPFGLKPVEIVAACITLMLFVLVVVYYMVGLAPEKDRLSKLQKAEIEQMKSLAASASGQEGEQAPQADQSKLALDSLETFKSDHLQPRLATESKLRDLINSLALKNGLQIVGGIPMADKRIIEKEEANQSKRKVEEQSLDMFPRLEVDFTVAGDYAKLRSFLKELESSSMFVLLNQLSLTTQEDKDQEGGRARRIEGIQLTIRASVPFKE